MLYLSKGIVRKGSTKQQLSVVRGDQICTLSGREAALWLDGRFWFGMAYSKDYQIVRHLQSMGLAEAEEEDTTVNRYRILTRCICCPATSGRREKPMPEDEKTILTWLRRAGLRLTTAELTFLMEHHIEPEPGLLGVENRQALTEVIYTADTIGDDLLEHQMESAKCRDAVLAALLKLLVKKKILLL